MAKRFDLPKGSWLLVEEHLENGDPACIDELWKIHDADRLGSFAKTWYHDRRPASRRLMLEYLSRPLAAYRHEALVKRLFKLAESNSDDEVMTSFMVAFDRSLRRVRKTRNRYDWNTRESWIEESVRVPAGEVIPKNRNPYVFPEPKTGEMLAAPTRRQHDRMRLFSVRTRSYLRRRIWRYLRNLGKSDPNRYVASLVSAMAKYTDADFVDGLALLDNWSLMHVLFHSSDVLVAKSSGWRVRDGRALSELKPSPAFSQAWQLDSKPLVELLGTAESKTVRHWSISLLRDFHPNAISRLPIHILLKWLDSDDPDLAQLAADALKNSSELTMVTVARWLNLTETVNPQVLAIICDLMRSRLSADSYSLEEVVRLACARPFPVARLGADWLISKKIETNEHVSVLMQVVQAEADSVRGELLGLLKSKLSAMATRNPDCILELLDSKYSDARQEGWQWMVEEPQLAEDISIWLKLLESPYDDIRFRLLDLLKQHSIPSNKNPIPTNTPQPSLQSSRVLSLNPKRLDTKLLRQLWSTTLLNIHRGGRYKPTVVNAIVQHLLDSPQDAFELVPILAIAVRSGRSTEFAAGLSGIVRLLDAKPELKESLNRFFPEMVVGH
jgi:hypothetical protein